MSAGYVRQSKSVLSEQEIRFLNYEESSCNDHFHELRNLICDSPINQEEDLSLEVEIDENLKSLLESPGTCKDHFDVTIIKQSNSHQETTVSLGFNELSDFIEMVNYHNIKDKKKVAEKQYNEFELMNAEEFNLSPNEDYETATTPNSRSEIDTTLDLIKEQTVYTTPYNTFDKIHKKLPCLRSHNDEKPGTPCLCQHCGMVGVLVESQKRPAIPHQPCPKTATPKLSQTRKRIIDLRSKSKSETNLILLRELSNKITSLESRLSDHEEKTVRKDYFKFVIHKLLTQYSSKINELKTNKLTPGINIATQYSKTNPFVEKKRHAEEAERRKKYYHSDSQEKIFDSNSEKKLDSYRRSRRESSKNKQTEKLLNVKHQVATMIEERVRHSKRQTKALKTERNDDILKLPSNTDNMKVDSPKQSVYHANRMNPNPFQSKRNKSKEKSCDECYSTETLQQLCDMVCNKYLEKKDEKKIKREMKKESRKKQEPVEYPDAIPQTLIKTPPVEEPPDKLNVSYINPAAKVWEEGSADFDGELAPEKAPKKVSNKHSIEGTVKQFFSKLLKFGGSKSVVPIDTETGDTETTTTD